MHFLDKNQIEVTRVSVIFNFWHFFFLLTYILKLKYNYIIFSI